MIGSGDLVGEVAGIGFEGLKWALVAILRDADLLQLFHRVVDQDGSLGEGLRGERHRDRPNAEMDRVALAQPHLAKSGVVAKITLISSIVSP